ncbi:ABC transporter permease [Brachybacterium sp. AOP42-C2-15]|uniref:ABC transporter permease n=1 Tax=Brachybacterium sp. AOP42-C2-15 TaxID=3457670 RepID=UPI004033A474
MARRATDSEVTSIAEVKQALEVRGLDSSELRPIGIRPPLGAYIVQLWHRRAFIWMDSRHRAATQNAKNRLGNVWLILRPLVDSVFYFIIFGLILGGRGDVENYAAFVVIGILTYRSTAAAISQGVSAMTAGKSMIRAFNFPRAAIPLASAVRDTMISVIAVVVMCLVIWMVPPFAPPTTTWVFLPLIFAIHNVLNLGIRFWVARLGFILPDMSQIMSVISRFLLYGSGVIFPIERFVTHPVALAIIEANPLFQVISIYRSLLMDGVMPPLSTWLFTTAVTMGILILGFIFFWRGEASYGREQR